MTMLTGEPMPNMSTAIVIGIGGSGVQTLGRLRRAVRDATRPDNVLVDNVHLLAMDAVDQSRQNPPLPAECYLAEDEYFNIVGDNPINAYEYVSQAFAFDAALQQSWDPDYTPPNEPLTDGLKRSRGLGDLAFELNRARVESQIELVFSRALAGGDQRAIYQQAAQARLPVIIAASACGGTGASGFLHVLHTVHRIALRRGVRLQVYPVVYLPRVFYDAVGKGLDATTIRQAHKSNAYAFLGELELMLTDPTALDRHFARRADEKILTRITPQDVVATVFLVDGQLSDGTVLTQQASYQLAADSLHSLLLTDSSNRLGIEGTNAGAPGLDAADPPQRRAYGSFGAFSITYPGTTYRRYLAARTRAELLQHYLLDAEVNVVEHGLVVRDNLVSRLEALTQGARRDLESGNAVRDLLGKVGNIVGDLEDVDDLEGLQAEAQALEHLADQAVREMTSKRPGLRHAASQMLDDVIDSTIEQSGEGLSALIFALDKAAQQLAASAGTAEQKMTSAIGDVDKLSGSGGGLTEAQEGLRSAWTAFLPLRLREKRRAADHYADVAMRYASRIVDTQVYQLAYDVLDEAGERLRTAHEWLRSAEKVLQEELSATDRLWRLDDLSGKDAAEPGQTLLVPEGVLPEVEDSVLAKAAWARVQQNLQDQADLRRGGDSAGTRGASTGRDWLRSFYRDLRRHGTERGLVAVGAGNEYPREQQLALSQFLRQLQKAADQWSDEATTLPADLVAAARRADAVAAGDQWSEDEVGEQERRLQAALGNLPDRMLVPLSFEPGRLRLQPGESVNPPLEVVAASGDLLADLAQRMPQANRRFVDSRDPERVSSTTARYGLTVGCVSGIDEWYHAYRDVIERRAAMRTKANQPPPHLKRSLRQEVLHNPLVRASYSDRDVADLVVKAVAVSLKANAPVTFEDRREGNRRFRYVLGRRTEVRNGELTPIGEQEELGHELAEWFDAIGRHRYLSTSIDEVFDFVLEAAFRLADTDDDSALAELRDLTERFRTRNSEAWSRLRDVAEPDEDVARAAAIRGALADAGARLMATLQLQVQATGFPGA